MRRQRSTAARTPGRRRSIQLLRQRRSAEGGNPPLLRVGWLGSKRLCRPCLQGWLRHAQRLRQFQGLLLQNHIHQRGPSPLRHCQVLLWTLWSQLWLMRGQQASVLWDGIHLWVNGVDSPRWSLARPGNSGMITASCRCFMLKAPRGRKLLRRTEFHEHRRLSQTRLGMRSLLLMPASLRTRGKRCVRLRPESLFSLLRSPSSMRGLSLNFAPAPVCRSNLGSALTCMRWMT